MKNVSCLWASMPKGFLIKYTDPESGENVLKGLEGRLFLQRRDGTFLRFEEGKSLPGVYSAGGLSAEVLLHTKHYSFRKTDGELNIRLQYLLLPFGEEISLELLLREKPSEK
ncbi:MAG: hypothetical protein ACI3XN_00030 [Eubacteriales bacterium]|nr:DUF1934 family protein [Clostridiales bacterium]